MIPNKIIYRAAKTDIELQQILELQALNLKPALDKEEQRTQGFVTLKHTLPLLKKMQDECPQIVALRGNQVLGYALCMSPNHQDLLPELSPMFQTIREKLGGHTPYRVMGQICIAKEARKQGVFRGLYQCLRDRVQPLPILTEVAEENVRSLQAHLAIGFRVIANRSGNGTNWHVIQWP